jgi:hypothetical protein
MMLGHGPADIARRIRATVPDVRLIAVLRNPVDRAQSALVHHKRAGRIHPRAALLETVRTCSPEEDWMGIVTGGWYAVSLQPFVELFGERLLVLLHDDIGPDTSAVFARALRHVGAAPDFVPASLERVVFSNRDGADVGTGVSPEEWAELFEYFRDDVDRLERMLGRDLSIWRLPTCTR